MFIKSTYRLAIQLGGDTDTIASMAGAISGAYLGIEVCINLVFNWLPPGGKGTGGTKINIKFYCINYRK